MLVPVMWLRDYVDLPGDAGEIVARLAALGFPVDEVIARPRLSNVVVGRIVKLERHPNADRLQLCTIDVGAEKTLLIATAATNVAEGQTVPVARIGAQLAGGLTIAPRKMRGIDSEGMLISAEEIGLEGSWFEDGIMQLEPDFAPGTDFIAHFHLNDPVLDVDVTPNRPDALSIVGLARELAASFGTTLREPQTQLTYEGGSDEVRVTIETLDCKRFVFQEVSGVRVRPAKTWMRIRLALAHQRPINNVVDISNFVMLELGQPLHFFDRERIAGAHLIVRDGREGETFVTLDEQERVLDPRVMVIADEQGATSIAGIMGGLRSEVEATTHEVLIEAASWDGPRVRRASTALKLRTEASTRFEKSLPAALTDHGAARAARLLEEEGGTVRMPRAVGKPIVWAGAVSLAPGDVTRLLGFTVSNDEIERALRSLGFVVNAQGDRFAVTPPYWRGDVQIVADLVEEVARVTGYDRVESVVPPILPQNVSSAQFEREMELATRLAGHGYIEFVTLSLQPAEVARVWRDNGIEIPAPVEIANPLSEDQRWMRFSLAPALLEFAARDRALRPYRVFELGHVFANAPSPQVPREDVHLTALHAGGSQAFGRLKSDLSALVRAVTGVEVEVARGSYAGLHPGKTAALRAGGTVVGYVGFIDPRLARAYELDDDIALGTLFLDALPQSIVRTYVSPSKFPPVDRDLAVVVPHDVLAGEVTAVVRAQPLVRSAAVFDEYRGPQVGENRKSLALRIVLQSDEGTLTDHAADEAIAGIVAALHQRFGATQRA